MLDDVNNIMLNKELNLGYNTAIEQDDAYNEVEIALQKHGYLDKTAAPSIDSEIARVMEKRRNQQKKVVNERNGISNDNGSDESENDDETNDDSEEDSNESENENEKTSTDNEEESNSDESSIDENDINIQNESEENISANEFIQPYVLEYELEESDEDESDNSKLNSQSLNSEDERVEEKNRKFENKINQAIQRFGLEKKIVDGKEVLIEPEYLDPEFDEEMREAERKAPPDPHDDSWYKDIEAEHQTSESKEFFKPLDPPFGSQESTTSENTESNQPSKPTRKPCILDIPNVNDSKNNQPSKPTRKPCILDISNVNNTETNQPAKPARKPCILDIPNVNNTETDQPTKTTRKPCILDIPNVNNTESSQPEKNDSNISEFNDDENNENNEEAGDKMDDMLSKRIVLLRSGRNNTDFEDDVEEAISTISKTKKQEFIDLLSEALNDALHDKLLQMYHINLVRDLIEKNDLKYLFPDLDDWLKNDCVLKNADTYDMNNNATQTQKAKTEYSIQRLLTYGSLDSIYRYIHYTSENIEDYLISSSNNIYAAKNRLCLSEERVNNIIKDFITNWKRWTRVSIWSVLFEKILIPIVKMYYNKITYNTRSQFYMLYKSEGIRNLSSTYFKYLNKMYDFLLYTNHNTDNYIDNQIIEQWKRNKSFEELTNILYSNNDSVENSISCQCADDATLKEIFAVFVSKLSGSVEVEVVKAFTVFLGKMNIVLSNSSDLGFNDLVRNMYLSFTDNQNLELFEALKHFVELNKSGNSSFTQLISDYPTIDRINKIISNLDGQV